MNAFQDVTEEVRASAPNAEQAKGNGTIAPMTYALLRDLRPNLICNEIVKNLIPRNAFGEVHADAGGGKTAIVVDLFLHVASGMEYRGRRVEQQPTIYVALEGHGGIDNRVIAAAQELGIEDSPFALVKATNNFRDPVVAADVARIARELMRKFGGTCPMIALDTYTQALGASGSDCDPADVSAFIANVQQQLLTVATVLVLHHFGKDSSRGGRGWSGLRAALDFELEIDHEGDLRTMRVTKARDGSDQQPACCYRLHGRQIGVDQHEEPVTAVVVEHLADEDTVKRGKRLSGKARAVQEKLWTCIKDCNQSWPLADQPGLRCTMLGVLEKACVEPGVISKSPDIKQRRRVFREAIEELEKAGAIVRDGERGERLFPPAG